MLDKNIDMALVGKSYLSFALSFELLKSGKKILLLNDKRMKFGPIYTNHFGLIEQNFLKVWGLERGIRPFREVDKYTKEISYQIVIKEKRVSLGGTPASNLRELMRKLPFIWGYKWKDNISSILLEFDDEAFNTDFYSFVNLLAFDTFRFKSIQSFNFSVFYGHAFPLLKRLFNLLKEPIKKQTHIKDHEVWEFFTFIYMSRGMYQNKLSFKGSDFELFHVLISLLSPLYRLDQDKILTDLIEENHSKGGQYKETKIREWLFHKQKPWSIELASYDGIIHPKKISFLGGNPSGIPVGIEKNNVIYQSINICCKFSEKVFFGDPGECVLFSTVEKIGTSLPLWFAEFDPKEVRGIVLLKHRKGSKLEFVKDKIEKLFLKEIKQFLSKSDLKPSSVELSNSEDLWPEEEKFTRKIRRLESPISKNIKLNDASTPGHSGPLKNVYYFGPYREGPLGLLSTFMDIKDGHQYM